MISQKIQANNPIKSNYHEFLLKYKLRKTDFGQVFHKVHFAVHLLEYLIDKQL